MRIPLLMLSTMIAGIHPAIALEEHDHPIPETLGEVNFQTSCSPEVRSAFNRAVALMHSFTYGASEQAFREITQQDPSCAMAHWGIALSRYHPLWAPPSADDMKEGMQAVQNALRTKPATRREQLFIEAAAAFYNDAERPHADRAKAYEKAMARLAASEPNDDEAQIFYALALLATAIPTDTTHANQKRAAKILEPLYQKLSNHPGAAHYLIHAYDSVELASAGLEAARAYSQIAPSAPHAQHMPSHIFTRVGMWEDSIRSNLAARDAAHEQGDIGEELHAMDYLTYAYLQLGKFQDAQRIVREALAMKALSASDFKIGYAGNAMPVRLAVEQGQWKDAAALRPLEGSAPQVAAIVYWARAVAQSRNGHLERAGAELAKLTESYQQLRSTGNSYWATQTSILQREARAWMAFASGDETGAIALMREAATEEDAIEKLPVTPGPIVPAREQLGEMLLESGRTDEARIEYQNALKTSPGRRNAVLALARMEASTRR